MSEQSSRMLRVAGVGVGMLSLSILAVAAIHIGVSGQASAFTVPLGGDITHAPPLPTMQMGQTAVQNSQTVATTTTTAAGH